MKNIGIYKIENSLNGKFYIGSSCRIIQRWKRHTSDLKCKKHHSVALQRAFNKYGDIFNYNVVEFCSKKDLLKREQYYIDTLNPHYNTCKIAKNCSGIKQSCFTISKRKLSLQKYWEVEGLKRPNSKQNLKKKKEFNEQLKAGKITRNLQIIKDLKSGLKQVDIAKKYNLSPSVITQLKKKNRVKTEIKSMKGSSNGFAKLTELQVREIKQLLLNNVKHQVLADSYNVKVRTIKAIKSGQNWSHIKL